MIVILLIPVGRKAIKRYTVDPYRMPDGRWIALVDGLRNGDMAK